jgi:hypothetical protein
MYSSAWFVSRHSVLLLLDQVVYIGKVACTGSYSKSPPCSNKAQVILVSTVSNQILYGVCSPDNRPVIRQGVGG